MTTCTQSGRLSREYPKRRLSSPLNGGSASKYVLVIEQHVEGDVEQIAPARHQVIEKHLLVLEQSIVTLIKLVNVCKTSITTPAGLQARCDRTTFDKAAIPIPATATGRRPI